MTRDVGGNSNACLILSRLYCATGRRANCPRGIEIGETHSILCELVDIGGIDKIISITADISPAKVVNKDKNDVGSGVGQQICRITKEKTK